uniref:Uncharacterized protein n=1 Tax=Anguilla anguilla TaxID=7936 RepID=A0A0E9U4Z1_ANGAN
MQRKMNLANVHKYTDCQCIIDMTEYGYLIIFSRLKSSHLVESHNSCERP